MSQNNVIKEISYPFHDLIVFKDRESMEKNLWNRYEPGDSKVTGLGYIGYFRNASVYVMNEQREWDLWMEVCDLVQYQDMHFSLKIFLEPPDFALVTQLMQDVDYVFPTKNTVYFCHSRTEKLRRKRVKPACMKEKEEIYQEEEN
jgi:hypothetical protein